MRRLLAAALSALALLAAAAAPAATVEAVPLQVLAPATQTSTTTREFVNVLGRTRPGMRVTVAGEAVTVYATGVFARDRVPLAPGLNRIRVEAVDPAGATAEPPRSHAEIVLEVQRLPAPEPPPAPARDRIDFDPASVQPRERLRLAPGEPFEVGLRATPGLLVQARLPGGEWQPLAEDPSRPGRYAAALHLAEGPDTEPGPVQLRLLAAPTLELQGPRERVVDTPDHGDRKRTGGGPLTPRAHRSRARGHAPRDLLRDAPTSRGSGPCCAPR